MNQPPDSGTPAFTDLVALDKTVHEPSRLAILTALSACRSADYTFLQRLTGLLSGSLTQHLARLEEAGLVSITKGFSGKYPQTRVTITTLGYEAIDRHWKQLESVRQAAIDWKLSEDLGRS